MTRSDLAAPRARSSCLLRPVVPSVHLRSVRTAYTAVSLCLLSLGCSPELVAVPPSQDASAEDAAPPTDLGAPATDTGAQAPDGGAPASDVAVTPDVVIATDVPSPLDVATAPDVIAPTDVATAPDVPARPDVPAPPDVVTAPDSGAAEGPPSAFVDALIGTWATRTRTLTEQTVPVLGTVRTTSRAYAIAVFARAGSTVTVTERACRVVFDRSSLGTTSISDRAVQALAPATAPIAFAQVGGAWRWSRAARSVAVGWRPSMNADEALPATRTDPRVVDSDGDGNPGVSVRIMNLLANGSVYVVQRQRSALSGDQASDRTPRAVNDPSGSTQRTIGASTNLLAQDIPSRVDTAPTNNGVTFARLAPDADCAAVIARLPMLFP
ncbi:MAG: hypothetical protein R3A48_15140 [Polyangiales bacterium]